MERELVQNPSSQDLSGDDLFGDDLFGDDLLELAQKILESPNIFCSLPTKTSFAEVSQRARNVVACCSFSNLEGMADSRPRLIRREKTWHPGSNGQKRAATSLSRVPTLTD